MLSFAGVSHSLQNRAQKSVESLFFFDSLFSRRKTHSFGIPIPGHHFGPETGRHVQRPGGRPSHSTVLAQRRAALVFFGRGSRVYGGVGLFAGLPESGALSLRPLLVCGVQLVGKLLLFGLIASEGESDVETRAQRQTGSGRPKRALRLSERRLSASGDSLETANRC